MVVKDFTIVVDNIMIVVEINNWVSDRRALKLIENTGVGVVF